MKPMLEEDLRIINNESILYVLKKYYKDVIENRYKELIKQEQTAYTNIIKLWLEREDDEKTLGSVYIQDMETWRKQEEEE